MGLEENEITPKKKNKKKKKKKGFIRKVINFFVKSFLVFSLVTSFPILIFFLAIGAGGKEPYYIAPSSNEKITFGGELPEICKQYLPVIEEEIEKNGVLNTIDHPFILLAMMAQESGCDANKHMDVFQSSESLGFSACSGTHCQITTRESINQGVKYLSENFAKLNSYGRKEIKIAVQSYNFGVGFISYYVENEPQDIFKKEHAVNFACKQNPSCAYGDDNYIENVWRYLAVTGPTFGDGTLPVIPIVGTPLLITAEFGYYEFGKHNGIDLVVGVAGNPVVAAGDGIVVDTTISEGRVGHGNSVFIKHSDNLYTRYSHMLDNSVVVKIGDEVKAGDLLGEMGNTGFSTGNHLHFETRTKSGSGSDGGAVNPRDYVDFGQ